MKVKIETHYVVTMTAGEKAAIEFCLAYTLSHGAMVIPVDFSEKVIGEMSQKLGGTP